jgi:hypothetical protein
MLGYRVVRCGCGGGAGGWRVSPHDWIGRVRVCYATGYMNQEDVRRSSVDGRCRDTDGSGELFGTVWDGRSSSLGAYKIVYKAMYRGI